MWQETVACLSCCISILFHHWRTFSTEKKHVYVADATDIINKWLLALATANEYRTERQALEGLSAIVESLPWPNDDVP